MKVFINIKSVSYYMIIFKKKINKFRTLYQINTFKMIWILWNLIYIILDLKECYKLISSLKALLNLANIFNRLKSMNKIKN